MSNTSDITEIVCLSIIFFIITPGVIFTLPRKGTIVKIATIHTLIFAFMVIVVHRIMPYYYRNNTEGFEIPFTPNYNKKTQAIDISMNFNGIPFPVSLSRDASNNSSITMDSAIILDLLANPKKYLEDPSNISVFSDSSAVTMALPNLWLY
jgi:hypothetical protein